MSAFVMKGVSHCGARSPRDALVANSVSVLMPGYRKILNDKYGRDNVHLRAHGILARRSSFRILRDEEPRLTEFWLLANGGRPNVSS